VLDLKVCIVEDEVILIEDLKQNIEQIDGYSVVGSATTANDAIELILEKTPDLVLLDLKLKGAGTGVDVIKAVSDLSGVFIVIFSAYAEGYYEDAAKGKNVLAYLEKPISEMSLQQALKDIKEKISK